jgi:hypothetical protein
MAARIPFLGSRRPARRPSVTRRPQKDQATPRLVTVLHLPGPSSVASFRIVAELVSGMDVPLCVGFSKQEVWEHLRALGRNTPAGTVALRVQRWVGYAGRGRWEDVAR